MGQWLSSPRNRTPVGPMTPRNAAENLEDPDDNPRELWENLRSSSTLHGLYRASESRRSVRRLAWLFILLSACGALLYQLKENINKWKQYEVLFSNEFEVPKSLPFPTVSICNQNMMRKSKIEGKDGQRYIDSLFWWSRMTSAAHGKSEPFDIEQEVFMNGHNLTEMMHMCAFSGKYCTAEEFVPFLNYRHGLCYSFNSLRTLSVNHAGPDTGLSLQLDAQPDEYYGYYSHEGTGFRIVVHDEKQMPAMDNGLTVSPGFNTNVKIKRKEFSRLPSPYKSHCGNKSLVSSEHYSKRRCESECYAKIAIEKCGCRSMGTPKGYKSRVRVCSTQEDIKCDNKLFVDINMERKCDCPHPCEEVKYSTEISTLYFPSRPQLDELVQYYKTNYKEYYEYYISQHSQADYDDYVEKQYRKSMVQINIRYETLATSVVKERPAYTFSDVVADFGGNMGLFVGCSLLTLVEMVDFLILVCLALWRKQYKRGPASPNLAA